MPVRIHYVSLPEDSNSQNMIPKPAQKHIEWNQILDELLRNVSQCLSETGLLRLLCMEEGMDNAYAYFSLEIEGILVDFGERNALVPCNSLIANLVFDEFDTEKSQYVCHLPAGLLHDSEYQRLMRPPLVGHKCLLSKLPVATAKPCKIYGEGTDVYGIPIFRCTLDQDWMKPTTIYGLLQYLARKNFIPAKRVTDMVCGPVPDEELLEFLKGAKLSQESGVKMPVHKADKNGSEEEKSNWNAIMDHYCGIGHRTANLAKYPDSLLQIQGSWDLYRFKELKKREDLPFINGTWYEVSGLYAKNPQEDIAPDAECVAIDFGTANTVAAIYPVNGSITTMPIGGGEGCGQIENPTILKFEDIRGFLAAYEQSQYRPDTKFEQVTTSHTAKQDFESPAGDDKDDCEKSMNMLQYLNQLKQWINEPNRIVQLTDGSRDCDIKLGRKMELKSLTVDPVELYAYYIGLSINDMRWEKIYLRYLLSYSATYSEYSKEWIRSSFEKGLRKALPPDVEKKAKLDVRLWQDEATSYAICALSRYLSADEDTCAQNQGIFYGIYDFGGGTLDFSFGVMKLDRKTGQRRFIQLQRGGSPVLGCENMLDELAFDLFSQNAAALKQLKIKCNIPFGSDPRQHLNNPVAGRSEAARFNTCSLAAYLRNKWIKWTGPDTYAANRSDSADEALEDDEHFDGFTLYSEDGVKYEWTGHEADDAASYVVTLDIPDGTIKEFFNSKVVEGIDLFLACYKNVVSREENQSYGTLPCHVFLAGNASQAPGVYTLFKDKTSAEGFVVKPPLPTEADKRKKEEKPYLDIPTAKSGVAYGLLMSRPGVEDVVVESKLPEINFHYHIGLRTKSTMNDGRGMFCLLLEKGSIPKYDAGEFQKVRKVPKMPKTFEILYTFDDSYAMTKADREVGISVKTLAVNMPDEYAGKECCLYIRARPNSDIAAELGMSCTESNCLREEQIHIIGICDFAQGSFIPGAMDAETSLEPISNPETLPVQEPNDTLPPASSDKPADYRLGILQDSKVPLWRVDTDIFQTNKRPHHLCNVRENNFVLCYSPKGDPEWEQMTVTLEGDGTKKVFVLGVAGPSIVKIGCNSSGKPYEFYLNLRTKEIFEDYEGGNI